MLLLVLLLPAPAAEAGDDGIGALSTDYSLRSLDATAFSFFVRGVVAGPYTTVRQPNTPTVEGMHPHGHDRALP